MAPIDFIALLPLLIITIAPIIIMMTIAFVRNHKVIAGFSVLAFAVAFISIFYTSAVFPHFIEPLLVIDGYSALFLGLIFAGCLVISLIAYQYFKNKDEAREEFYILLFVAALGAGVMVCSKHFVSLFLGLEILSIALYVKIAYLRKRDYSIEAAAKYLVIASLSTAFMLFGMGLVYATTGNMSFEGLAEYMQQNSASSIMMAGFILMFAGIGFKLAIVPFHMWTPDVYQGAPAPVTAFLATISKAGVFAFLLRFFYVIDGHSNIALVTSLSVIAIITMFAGNILALQQQNVKRILAYSSIAHLGYLLVALIAGGMLGSVSAIFYLISYTITTLGTFGVISFISSNDKDAESIESYKGLYWRKPVLALLFSLMLLSLAGMPLTAGFIGKFFLVTAGASNNYWLLIISLVLASVIGLFYYLRIIVAMFKPIENNKQEVPDIKNVSWAGYTILFALAIGVLALGILPNSLVSAFGNLLGF